MFALLLLKAVVLQLQVPTIVGTALTTVGVMTRWKRSQKRNVVVPIEHEDQVVGLAVGHMIQPMDLKRPQYAQARKLLREQVKQGMSVHPSVMEALQK